MFKNIASRSQGRTLTATKDELDMYLEHPRVMTDEPLAWWYVRREEYPMLSRMAIDYLCVPGM